MERGSMSKKQELASQMTQKELSNIIKNAVFLAVFAAMLALGMIAGCASLLLK
jgi:hypothetical protein